MERAVKKRDIRSLLNPSNMAYGVFSLLLISLAVFVPGFMTVGNVINIFDQASTTGILAIGLTLILITNGIDISLPSILACSAVSGAIVMRDTQNALLGILCMLLVGLLCGFANGFAVAKMGMIPFVVTLSMKVVATGLTALLSQSQSIAGLPVIFIDIVNCKIAGIPFSVFVMAVFVILTQYGLDKTKYGRWIYGIGLNEKTALVCGIPNATVLICCYAFAGLCAAFSGMLMTARLASASAVMGSDTLLMDVIGSAVIGGASVKGGEGSAKGAVFGALLIVVIGNVLNLLNVTYYTMLIYKGLFIILFIYLDSLKSAKSQERRARSA